MDNNLQTIPLFGELSDDVLEAISQYLRREHYHRGATIFLQGAPALVPCPRIPLAQSNER